MAVGVLGTGSETSSTLGGQEWVLLVVPLGAARQLIERGAERCTSQFSPQEGRQINQIV